MQRMMGTRIFVKTFLLLLAFESVAGHPCTELCTSSSIPRSETPLLSCTRRGRFENLCDIKNPTKSEHALIHSLSEKILTYRSIQLPSQATSKLFIRKSAIRQIESRAFVHLPNLRILSLTCNSLIFIDQNSFEGLNYLSVLDLRRNHLNFLPGDVFTGLVRLTQLYLSHNQLMVMPLIANENRQVEALFIDLSHNHLTFMSSRNLDRTNGAFLQLDQNPFKCDDGWEWFYRHMANSSRILCFESVTCGPPPDIAISPEGSVSSTPAQEDKRPWETGSSTPDQEDKSPWETGSPTPDQKSYKTTFSPDQTATSFEMDSSVPEGTTTSPNHTRKRDEDTDVHDDNIGEGVLEVATVLGALLFAVSCAVIKVRLCSQAAAVPPAAPPSTDTAGHSENDYDERVYDSPSELEEVQQDHQYEDCSIDSIRKLRRTQRNASVLDKVKFAENSHFVEDSGQSQQRDGTACVVVHNLPSPLVKDDTNICAIQETKDAAVDIEIQSHVYDNDEHLQDVFHGDDHKENMNGNRAYDIDRPQATSVTGRLDNPETHNAKNGEVLDQNLSCNEGIQDGTLKEEPADHEPKPVQEATEFANESEGSLSESSNQQRSQSPPAISPRAAATIADEGIANEFGGENACTYVTTKENDTYEAAGTENSREEAGAAYCTGGPRAATKGNETYEAAGHGRAVLNQMAGYGTVTLQLTRYHPPC
uniref:LRRCT domain-containing protein n=1 Tax=Branchiostoma floridae TaxID=7739 RepID=C3ZUE6_BRAFL|eukprot:XP_002587863.1 hypothetical protein BRAFLDRAFT_94117 [Branchiostoma floridae]